MAMAYMALLSFLAMKDKTNVLYSYTQSLYKIKCKACIYFFKVRARISSSGSNSDFISFFPIGFFPSAKTIIFLNRALSYWLHLICFYGIEPINCYLCWTITDSGLFHDNQFDVR